MKTEILVSFFGGNLWPILKAQEKGDNRIFWDQFFDEYKKLILTRTKVATAANIDSIILDHKTIIARAPVRYWIDLIETILVMLLFRQSYNPTLPREDQKHVHLNL